jgi:mannose-6-phosphate isomerase-like protein (cupin superfamily)
MACHHSVLAPGHSPHAPHAHEEEELLMVLEGEAEIIIAGSPSDPVPRVVPMSPGQLVYHRAWQHHTLRNVSGRPVTYLMFKWSDAGRRNRIHRLIGRWLPSSRRQLPTGTFDLRGESGTDNEGGFAQVFAFEGPTHWLGRLQCHLTRLQPGAGYEAHADGYDVAVVLLAGSIEIGEVVLRNRGVAYFAAAEMHGMHNPGSQTATYIVFEFDRRSVPAR